MKRINTKLSTVAGLIGACLVLSGCHTDMWRQPKAVAQETTDFWADGQVERPKVEGTVAFGKIKTDDEMFKGRINGKLVTSLPKTIVIDGVTYDTKADLEKILKRGQERFDIFCSHCHGAVGDGQGMIAKRGLKLRRAPASYHTARLRELPIGHFFDVMTNGFGAMYPVKGRVEAGDRWAIASYVRVLQASQNVDVNSLSGEERNHVENPDSHKGTTSNGH